WLRLLLRSFRDLRLLRRVREDRRAVLVADVRPLPVQLGRVVEVPEELEQITVGDLLVVEDDLDGLGVTRRVTAHLWIRRAVGLAPRVPDASRKDAGRTSEVRLNAP